MGVDSQLYIPQTAVTGAGFWWKDSLRVLSAVTMTHLLSVNHPMHFRDSILQVFLLNSLSKKVRLKVEFFRLVVCRESLWLVINLDDKMTGIFIITSTKQSLYSDYVCTPGQDKLIQPLTPDNNENEFRLIKSPGKLKPQQIKFAIFKEFSPGFCNDLFSLQADNKMQNDFLFRSDPH